MTEKQREVIHDLYQKHDEGYATYGGWQKCKFLIYKNNVIERDKYITICRDEVYDYNHEGIPKARFVRNLISPEGEIKFIDDILTEEEAIGYISVLTEIDINTI
jgi:hypothetical protein